MVNRFMLKLTELLFVSVIYILAIILYYKWNFIAGILLIICAFFVFVNNARWNKTIIDLSSLFLVSWLSTLGLSMLRLLKYQIPWTIDFFFITYLGIISMVLGLNIGKRIKMKTLVIKRSFRMSYMVVIIATLISIIMFILSYMQTGIIPLFSNKLTAYHDHYTKFYLIQVGMLPSAGLAFWVAKSFPLKRHQKVLMYFIIIIQLIIFPLLYVNRGVFVIGILFNLPALYYFSKNRKRLIKIGVISFIILILIITTARNYSDDEVDFFFQPKTVTIKDSDFKLSSNMAMIYGYLTISHDNFNYNQKRIASYSYGSRLLQPFEVIIGTDLLKNLRAKNDLQNVSFGLNTHNLMGIIYYDFGLFGIISILFIYGMFFGIIERKFRRNMNPFNALVYGGCIIVTAFSFFTAWTTQFTLWMWWGTTFIFWLIHSKIKINIKSI